MITSSFIFYQRQCLRWFTPSLDDLLKEISLGLHSNINQKVISLAFAVLCFQRFLLSVLQWKRSKSRTFFDSLIVILLLFRYFTIMILIYSPWLGKFRRHVRRNIRIFSNLIYDFAILSAMISCYYSIYPERIMFLNKYNNTLYAHKEYNKAVYAHRLQLFWMSQYFYSLISNTMNNSNVFWSLKK